MGDYVHRAIAAINVASGGGWKWDQQTFELILRGLTPTLRKLTNDWEFVGDDNPTHEPAHGTTPIYSLKHFRSIAAARFNSMSAQDIHYANLEQMSRWTSKQQQAAATLGNLPLLRKICPIFKRPDLTRTTHRRLFISSPP